ncbi:MAG: GTP cyclohydrolase, partial [Flavobacteriaceae bacterium]|nr:GTP cyclohydrolase [Flavobacteriaceae bacterium]
KRGIEKCIRTPELEENIAIKNLWSAFDPKVHKRRRTYKKSL